MPEVVTFHGIEFRVVGEKIMVLDSGVDLTPALDQAAVEIILSRAAQIRRARRG